MHLAVQRTWKLFFGFRVSYNPINFKYNLGDLEVRIKQALKILKSNLSKIPVIIERKNGEDKIPELKQSKYLFPEDFKLHDFIMTIRKKLQLSEKQSITFFFANKNKLFTTDKTMKQIYDEWKDKDGFLYCNYVNENVVG